LTYLRGLLLAEGRKSVEPMALLLSERSNEDPSFSQNSVMALQRFLTMSPWEAADVQREIQAVFAEEFVPSTKQWSIGTVGVIDESSFPKQGTHSVGVKRQWCGRLGKVENCQVGVFLTGVTPDATVLLDHQLFLPEEWAKDRIRRKKTRVPKHIKFQTKPEIAGQLVQNTVQASLVRFDWIIADEEYGRSGKFLDKQESLGQRYLLEVPLDTTVFTREPQHKTPDDSVRQVRDLARDLLPDAWQNFQLREGAKGPLVYQFARLRVWAVRHRWAGPAIWVVFRRALDGSELKAYVSNASEDVALEPMALVTGTRYRVEEFFEDGKGLVGMGDYEARSWTSWHHHMSLVALAQLYLVQTRQELKRNTPELTLDMALRLVKSALDRPVLSTDDAIELIQYHLNRNHVAHQSHRKSWLARNKNTKFETLL
jgi:SRSO17 transposase